MKSVFVLSAGIVGFAILAACEFLVEPSDGDLAQEASFVREEMNQGSQIRCHFNEPFITIKMRNHHAELIQLGMGETPDQFSLEIQSIAVEDQSNLITLDDGVVLEIENRAPEICYDDMSGEPFDYFAKLHDWGIHGDLPVSPKTGCCQVDKLIGVQ